MPISEREFLEQFSVENIIRQATQPPETLRLPAAYASSRPDVLGLEVDRLLGQMSPVRPTYAPQDRSGIPERRPPRSIALDQGSDRSNAALAPFELKPTTHEGPFARVGLNLGLNELEDWIRKRESSGNYTALNREQKGNTASGAYQYTDATWNGFGGYAKAMLAPPHVQDAKFRQDLQARARQYGGDPFKMIAAHYLPAAASDPSTWTQPYTLKSGKQVKPVASYIAYVIRGTPLEQQFHAYLARQQ